MNNIDSETCELVQTKSHKTDGRFKSMIKQKEQKINTKIPQVNNTFSKSQWIKDKIIQQINGPIYEHSTKSHRNQLRKTIFQTTKYMILAKSKLFSLNYKYQKAHINSFSPKNLNKAFTFKSKLTFSEQITSSKYKSLQLSQNKTQNYYKLQPQASKLPLIENTTYKSKFYQRSIKPNQQFSEKQSKPIKHIKGLIYKSHHIKKIRNQNQSIQLLPWDTYESYLY